MSFFWKLNFTITNLLRLLPGDLYRRMAQPRKPLHILFCMVDHFEPGALNAAIDIEKDRMLQLLTKYPQLCENHRDTNEHPPKRTWFFPPHYHRNNNLKELVSLCKAGYGEIELHLHHGKIKPDTSQNLEKTIRQCIAEYSEFGIFGSQTGQKKYGFIHGNSALDNSRNGRLCGVNNEIEILVRTGCYADFTFPCASEPNPRKINAIYYAVDDPQKPKSYNSGRDVIAGGQCPAESLMLVPGPLFPHFKGNSPLSLRLYTPVIDGLPPVNKSRIDAWVRANIHIQGCNNWVIIKTHTHGAVEGDAVLGDEMDYILSELEGRYNDGKNFFLHYVTTRELYNIIKAIEAGEPQTSPEDYREYLVKRPAYDDSPAISSASNHLTDLVSRTYR